MCVGLSARVISVKGATAVIDATGARRSVSAELLDDLEPGDYVMVHAGIAIAKITNSSVEVNGWGRRQLMVSGSKGTVNIVPLENPCRMFYSDLDIATHHHVDYQVQLDVTDLPKDCRYDEMMQCFYAYITGQKKNPYSYDHDRLVQALLWEIVGGKA